MRFLTFIFLFVNLNTFGQQTATSDYLNKKKSLHYYKNIVSFIDSIPNKEAYKNCSILKFKISFRNIYNSDTNIYYFYSDSVFSKSVDSLFRKTKLGDEYIISPTLISKSGNTFLTPNYSIIYNDEHKWNKRKTYSSF